MPLARRHCRARRASWHAGLAALAGLAGMVLMLAPVRAASLPASNAPALPSRSRFT